MNNLEALILTTFLTGCANISYSPEDKNIEFCYKTAEYEIVVQPQIKRGYGVKIRYEF